MTRITIIKSDSHVGIDGQFFPVDCSDLPENFHALQWYGTLGEVEWLGNPKPQNTEIISIAPYQKYIDRWNAAKTAYEAQIAAMLAEQNAIANTANNSANTA